MFSFFMSLSLFKYGKIIFSTLETVTYSLKRQFKKTAT